MNDIPEMFRPKPLEGTVQDQLTLAVRDLWTMVVESGEGFVVFTDRRRQNARVERISDGRFGVVWEEVDGSLIPYDRTFDNPREAVFHGYQGPH